MKVLNLLLCAAATTAFMAPRAAVAPRTTRPMMELAELPTTLVADLPTIVVPPESEIGGLFLSPRGRGVAKDARRRRRALDARRGKKLVRDVVGALRPRSERSNARAPLKGTKHAPI